jgi:mRNA interferase MazF
MYIPNKGDIIWLNFNPQSGHEQAGLRPALVISPKEYNQKVGLGLFCPITSNRKGFPFEVIIPEGLKVKGVILSDHVKSLDWKMRKAKFACKLDKKIMKEVTDKLSLLISL